MNWTETSIGLLFGLATAACALWWVSRSRRSVLHGSDKPENSLNFLFENDTLVDISSEADALLSSAGEDYSWSGVSRLFQNRFHYVNQDLEPPDMDGITYYQAKDPVDHGVLEVRRSGSRIRVGLFAQESEESPNSEDVFSLRRELKNLKSANEVAPFPIWQTSNDDQVIWCNPAYDALYQDVFQTMPQSDMPLFRIPDPKLEPGKSRRIPVTSPTSRKTIWYDVRRSSTPSENFYTAVDANAIVRAEAAQRNFVQTLAKTFAHLPIGLAIFDDNRQLVLFNPAVIDLTGLGADFLSSRPNLLSFFDELRNRRLMPEPKNYNSWRQQIADLVAAAADGRYSETWTLASGRTYRVNGRPHPDGAIAFLIEDISEEVSLTRRFRAELEQGQSVLDSLRSAIAVFSSSGVLTTANKGYRELWSIDPDNSFADVSVIDCLRHWQHLSHASPIWGELRDFILEFGERTAWSAEVKLDKGGVLIIKAIPLPSGATMIQFLRPDEQNVDFPVSA